MSRVQDYIDAVAQLQTVDENRLVSVLLFGSAARDAVSESSDVDFILVLQNEAALDDRRRLVHAMSDLEILHGLRSPASRPKNRLAMFLERAGGEAHSCFCCTRDDLLSGDAARVFGLRAVEELFVDRIILASVIVSARTVRGEELLSLVRLPSIRRVDVFKALFGLAGLLMLSAVAFPVLPDATRYGMDALKHSLHSCYFCYHLNTVSLEEEIEFFHRRLGRSKTLLDLLDLRNNYRRSFRFLLRCIPVVFRLHVVTALDNRFPRRVTKG